ncbi:MAG: hypothetical protein HY270_15335 [Deltaproteobacteria bacterium]|nr:hypothetical protein [Deltaproteobacteria bacterium]
MNVPIGERIFGPFLKVAPRHTWSRFLVLAVDVAVFNLIFYETLRSLLLEPLGYTTAAGTMAWLAAFASLLFLLHGLKPRQGAPRLAGLMFEIVIFAGIFGLAAYAASFTTTDKGVDFSWLRIEIVKTPLWFKMFVKACPGFTTFAVVAVSVLAWRWVSSPQSRFVRLAPGIAVAAFIPAIVATFLPMTDDGSKWQFYVVMFTGPLIGFWILLACRASVLAFRMFPFVLHTALIALSYIGLIPVNALSPEFVCEGGASQPNQFGVARLFPPDDKKPDPSFRFLRKMILSDDRAYFSYGPTCGIYSVQRDTGALQQLPMRGLLRDIGWSKDGNSLFATNWMRGDFMAINGATLKPVCSADIFHQGMATPWSFVVDDTSDHVYMSNMTLPIVAELTVHMDADDCRVHIDRSIDFHATGYTGFTDGAYGLHVDRKRDRLYVLVGMLEGRFEMSLVEIELSSFTVLRNVRMPAGATLVPVRGRDTVLLPSYYLDTIYEVSLPDMKLVRTIEAAPTITAIEQDEKRGVFYATSRTTGELMVIDDASGKVLRSFAVGAKPEALKLARDADQLFLGSGRGIFRIDLARFWPAS